MSNALYVRGVLGAVESAVKAAWPDVVSIDSSPPSTAENLPACVVDWGPVAISFGDGAATMNRPCQRMQILIGGVFPLPITKAPSLEQLDRADALIAQLQTGPTFAGALMPLVTAVDPTQQLSRLENTVELLLTFECYIAVDHH